MTFNISNSLFLVVLQFKKFHVGFTSTSQHVSNVIFPEFTKRYAFLKHAIDLFECLSLTLGDTEEDEKNAEESYRTKDESRLGVESFDAVWKDKV